MARERERSEVGNSIRLDALGVCLCSANNIAAAFEPPRIQRRVSIITAAQCVHCCHRINLHSLGEYLRQRAASFMAG
jgi:hypothetical protein